MSRGISTNRNLQCHDISLETLDREFVSVARLSVLRHAILAKAKVRSFGVALRLKGREVTGTIPETARSIPGQDEVRRKSHGGLLPVLLLSTRVTWE